MLLSYVSSYLICIILTFVCTPMVKIVLRYFWVKFHVIIMHCKHYMYVAYSVCRTVYGVQCTVYSVRCTVYGVQCTAYSVRCTLYGVQCTVYSVRRTVYGVQCTTYSVRRTVYDVQCTAYSVRCTVYDVQCTAYSVRRTVYDVQCTVYTVRRTPNSTAYTLLYRLICIEYSIEVLYDNIGHTVYTYHTMYVYNYLYIGLKVYDFMACSAPYIMYIRSTMLL